jgi:hypothetical protein
MSQGNGHKPDIAERARVAAERLDGTAAAYHVDEYGDVVVEDEVQRSARIACERAAARATRLAAAQRGHEHPLTKFARVWGES